MNTELEREIYVIITTKLTEGIRNTPAAGSENQK
jgi:hypothetical protein